MEEGVVGKSTGLHRQLTDWKDQERRKGKVWVVSGFYKLLPVHHKCSVNSGSFLFLRGKSQVIHGYALKTPHGEYAMPHNKFGSHLYQIKIINT